MSFQGSSTVNQIVDNGLSGGLPGVFINRSSDSSTQIIATGYFAAQGRSFNPNIQGFGGQMRVGDIVLNVQSSAGASPGRVTLHAVTASTLNTTSATISTTGAYDISVSQSCTA